MGNDRSPANVQKTTFSCDRQHPLRTVRNTFALHGSSTQQRPLNERGRSLIQVQRSEEHTSELQSRFDLVCRLLLEKKKKKNKNLLILEKTQSIITHT